MKTYTFTLTIRTHENLAHCMTLLQERISSTAYGISNIGATNPTVNISYDKLETDEPLVKLNKIAEEIGEEL